MDFPCQYCPVRCETSQGLRSHLTQSKACRTKHSEQFSIDSGDDSDNLSEFSGESDVGDASGGHPASGPMDVDVFEARPAPQDGDDFGDSGDETHEPPPDIPATPTVTPAENPRKRPRATVEEVEDEEARWVQPFPKDRAAGAIFEKCQTQFEKLREEQKKAGRAPWEPFESEEEWELARWLMTSGISQMKTDEFLKLKKVRTIHWAIRDGR